MEQMADQGEMTKKIHVPAFGDVFEISFDAIEEKKDRLVISAKRRVNGFVPASYDPTEMRYVVEFIGTRAAYIRGYYKTRHHMGGWPFIWWDIRSYANHLEDPNVRVYVRDFFAHNEIKKLIIAMEGHYGTQNIVNSYIKDNLTRFQMGIKSGKSPQKIEQEWSRGMMEGLGYKYVEAFDTGKPQGKWQGVSVHWCKNIADLRG